MGGSIAPFPKHQFFDNSGDPAASWQLFTYVSGTSTKQATYTDEGLSSANTNPIVLDSAGRATIFLVPGQSYKFVMANDTDSDPPVSPIWTVDAVNATRATELDVDIVGVAGENLTNRQCVYLSDGSGGNTAGRWYKATSANTYSSTEAAAIGFVNGSAPAAGEEFSVRINGATNTRVSGSTSNMVAGTRYYVSTAGNITDSAPANARPVGVAASDSSLVTTQYAVGVRAYPFNWAFTSASTLTVAGPSTFSGLATFSTTPVGAAKISRCTSALTKNNNTTVANITGLAFSVAASETWAFTFYLKGVTTTTANWKFAITGPTTPTAVWYGHAKPSNIGIAATDTLGTAVLREGVTASPGTEEMIQISGYIRNSTNAGTIQLQMAQNTAEVFDTIIRAESYVVALREA